MLWFYMQRFQHSSLWLWNQFHCSLNIQSFEPVEKKKTCRHLDGTWTELGWCWSNFKMVRSKQNLEIYGRLLQNDEGEVEVEEKEVFVLLDWMCQLRYLLLQNDDNKALWNRFTGPHWGNIKDRLNTYMWHTNINQNTFQIHFSGLVLRNWS